MSTVLLIAALHIGHVPCIVVTDYDILKEALVTQGDIWMDRPIQLDYYDMVRFGYGGVILQNGDIWRQMRRLAVSSMRDFGVGRKSIEARIHDELEAFALDVDAYDEQPFRFGTSFNKAVLNVICNVLFGRRCEQFLALFSR